MNIKKPYQKNSNSANHLDVCICRKGHAGALCRQVLGVPLCFFCLQQRNKNQYKQALPNSAEGRGRFVVKAAADVL
jgi:hypothetical protein